MEPQHQQQNGEDVTQNNENTTTNKSNFLCRQSSSRWTPTSDQIRILKDLYYNNGVRSPSAEQIQKISTTLRQYGKIEGKNVFYWFQNHKARERQKKRFNTSNAASVDFPSVAYKCPTITPAGFPSSSSSCSSPGIVGVGSYPYGYGSITMEKSFRDCSISAGGGTLVGHNMWVGDQNSYSSSLYHNFIDHHQRKLIQFEDIQEDDQDHDTINYYHDEQPLPELETLPPFPLSGGGLLKPDTESCHASTWHHFPGNNHMACSRSTSLDLSLNSYTGGY